MLIIDSIHCALLLLYIVLHIVCAVVNLFNSHNKPVSVFNTVYR